MKICVCIVETHAFSDKALSVLITVHYLIVLTCLSSNGKFAARKTEGNQKSYLHKSKCWHQSVIRCNEASHAFTCNILRLLKSTLSTRANGQIRLKQN